MTSHKDQGNMEHSLTTLYLILIIAMSTGVVMICKGSVYVCISLLYDICRVIQ